MARDSAYLQVTVVYALPQSCWQESLHVPAGTTLRQVVHASGFARRFPDVDLNALTLGVYGARCTPDRLAADGDRVEIYRPLRFDPMESRRRRAAHHLRTRTRPSGMPLLSEAELEHTE